MKSQFFNRLASGHGSYMRYWEIQIINKGQVAGINDTALTG